MFRSNRARSWPTWMAPRLPPPPRTKTVRGFWFRWSNGIVTSQGELTADLNSKGAGEIVSFGEDTAGELYMLTLSGKVYAIEAE